MALAFQTSQCPARSIFRTHLSPGPEARRLRWPSGGRVAVKEPGLRSSGDERQSGWKAAGGERSVAVSSPEGLGSGPEGVHELGVELIEHPARGLRGCVDKRRETGLDGPGGPVGLAPGSLGRRAPANRTAVSPGQPPPRPLPPGLRSVGDSAPETDGPSREGETGLPSPRRRSARRWRLLLDSGRHTAGAGRSSTPSDLPWSRAAAVFTPGQSRTFSTKSSSLHSRGRTSVARPEPSLHSSPGSR